MRSMQSSTLRGIAAAVAVSAFAPEAHSAEPLHIIDGGAGAVILDERVRPAIPLTIDFAMLLKFEEPAGTIIIGNPQIADATLTDNHTVVITGRTVGKTNMIVLDETGTQISEVLLHVGTGPRPPRVVVHNGLQRQTYACAPRCEPVGAVGAEDGGTTTRRAGAGASDAGGPCEHPDDIAADGSRCGDRAASERPGGR